MQAFWNYQCDLIILASSCISIKPISVLSYPLIILQCFSFNARSPPHVKGKLVSTNLPGKSGLWIHSSCALWPNLRLPFWSVWQRKWGYGAQRTHGALPNSNWQRRHRLSSPVWVRGIYGHVSCVTMRSGAKLLHPSAYTSKHSWEWCTRYC